MSLHFANEKVHASGVNPKFEMEATEANGKHLSIRENSGVIEIYDEVSGTVVMTLENHSDRHKNGGGDYPDYYAHINKDGTIETAGVSGAYGTGSDIVPDSGYYSIIPHLITVTIGGTVGTGETISAQVTITYDNTTTDQVLPTKSLAAGATGDLIWDLTEIAGSYAQGGKITKISVAASSDQASTSTTVVGNIKGVEVI